MTKEGAIKLVKEVTGMSLDWDDAHYEALQMAIKALEKERWIPCSERLPEDDDDVIITTGFEIYIGWFDADDHTWRLRNDYITSIVAWMPLPEPYKE